MSNFLSQQDMQSLTSAALVKLVKDAGGSMTFKGEDLLYTGSVKIQRKDDEVIFSLRATS